MRNWYGNAQSAKQAPRSASGQRWLDRTGGHAKEVHAIYGSTDRATEDHSNDPLCRLAKSSAHFTDNPTYKGDPYPHNVHRYAAHEALGLHTTYSEPSQPVYDIDSIVRRAVRAGLTVVEYCAQLGIALS